MEDTYSLAYKHAQKADGIQNNLIEIPGHNVFGIFYDIKGNVASEKQFFLTDSVKHYLRGALYFNEIPKKSAWHLQPFSLQQPSGPISQKSA